MNTSLVDSKGRPLSSSRYFPEDNLDSGDMDKSGYDTCNKVITLFNDVAPLYKPMFDRQKECEMFLKDKQWSEEELRYFVKQNRAPLTINMMWTYSAQVSGIMGTGRQDLRISPIDNQKDPELARIAEQIFRHIAKNSSLAAIDALVFDDGKNGIGNWHINEVNGDNDSFDSYFDPMGDVYIDRTHWAQVLYDPESIDIEMRDMKWQMRYAYYRQDELVNHLNWGDKIKKLPFHKRAYEEWWQDIQGFLPMVNINQTDLVDVKNGYMVVLELFERVQKKVLQLFDPNGLYVGDYTDKPENINQYQENYNLYVLPGRSNYIRKTCILPYAFTVLGVTEKKRNYFPYVPCQSRVLGGRIPEASSYNASLIGIQREKNMRRSNIQETIVRNLRGGWWLVKGGQDGGRVLLDQINSQGHKIGQSFIVESKEHIPTPILQQSMTTQNLAYLEQGAEGDFEKVTGLGVQAYGGHSGSRESGILRAEKREESFTTLFGMIDEFDTRRTIVAKAAMERKAELMTMPTVLRITGEDNVSPAYIELTQDIVERFSQVSRFDIRVEESQYSLERKKTEQQERIELTDFTAKHLGADKVIPAFQQIWKSSNLPEGQEVAKAIEEKIAQDIELSELAKEEEQLLEQGKQI